MNGNLTAKLSKATLKYIENTPILSHGDFPWLVTKNIYSASTPKP